MRAVVAILGAAGHSPERGPVAGGDLYHAPRPESAEGPEVPRLPLLTTLSTAGSICTIIEHSQIKAGLKKYENKLTLLLG